MNTSQDNLFKRFLLVGAVIWGLGWMGCGERNNVGASGNTKTPGTTINETIEPETGTGATLAGPYFIATDGLEGGHKRIQVWQVSPDDWSFSKRYELTRTMNSPVQVQVPLGRTATRIFELVPTTTPVEEIFNDYTLGEISLATTGRVLGTIESIQRCVENSPHLFWALSLIYV
jgi:hypothetical protein